MQRETVELELTRDAIVKLDQMAACLNTTRADVIRRGLMMLEFSMDSGALAKK